MKKKYWMVLSRLKGETDFAPHNCCPYDFINHVYSEAEKYIVEHQEVDGEEEREYIIMEVQEHFKNKSELNKWLDWLEDNHPWHS